ncbi:Ig-like domain-containing protein, partial [Finegoldia magna]|uniref:Ig-like domain-containing protein n=1 Tax=Finegoldia magna TaxID=1260 RepID=UPI002910B4A9
ENEDGSTTTKTTIYDVDPETGELSNPQTTTKTTMPEIPEGKPTITDGKAENDSAKDTTTVSGKTKPNTEVTVKTSDGEEKTVTSNDEGNFTVEVSKQEKDSEIKVTPKGGDEETVKVIEKAGDRTTADKVDPNTPEKTGVKDPEKLSDKEKEEIKDTIEKANKDKFTEGTDVSVDDKGNVAITYPDGSKDTIPAKDLVFQYKHGDVEEHEKPELKIADIIEPSLQGKTEVGDKDHLTDKEKEDIKNKIEESNKGRS